MTDLDTDTSPPGFDAAFPAAERVRRLPGEPHPYMRPRNPPNLWILVWMTILSLGVAGLVITITVLL
ncbi:MAG: hypothetical protein IT305_29605 [Chloroflexi bacterium]|nr:hypothetical protein [Chloroflexota bacterium]